LPQEDRRLKLLIDGYNLLQAAGQFGSAAGVGTLESARLALLDFLVDSLSPADAKRTVVVFDAAAAPLGRPSVLEHDGLTVRFSRRQGSADDLIEELLETVEDPRHLTVVSSDHRVQRAARRRRAIPVDSESWVRDMRSAAENRQGDSNQRGAGGQQGSDKGTPDVGNPFPPDYLEEIERDLNQNGI
jgi:predicted RNA-binding protein with PIN domain